MMRAGLATGLVITALLLATPARAEYRAYQLEVVDLYDCRINKRETCHSAQVTTAFDPQQYLITHGGPYHIGVLMLATWMCYGDTSYYKLVCPRPPPRKPKFKVGDDVVITLQKHITEGWHGKVEVAYYQASVRSNVYGVRFPDRRGVYARYFQKDLKLAAPAPAGAGPGTTAAAGASSGTQGTPATAGGGAAPAAQPGAATPAATPASATPAAATPATASPATVTPPAPVGSAAAPAPSGLAAPPTTTSAPPAAPAGTPGQPLAVPPK